ncbi:MAG TPA: cation acetate symporter [Thioalkalivibrio sp.]|nr:cation acetate symporter [Thioalkalivibrio sp.]
MDLETLTWIVVGATFALYIGIAIWSRASSTGEFYVAGKGVHPVANGMATAADWMSAASFISMAGLIAFNGYDASVYLMGWTGGYVLLAMLLAPYLRKYGKFTVPEFIGERYYSQTARIVAVICLIVASITYVIGQMKGIGVAFSRFLEVDYNTGLYSGMAIVFIYAVLGGMKGITYTQIAQYVVLIFAYTVPAIFISLHLTGNPVPQLGLGSTVADGTYLLDKLDGVLVELGFAQYTIMKGTTLNMVLLTLSLMIGTAGLPHVIVRFFTVPSVRGARASAGWALFFIAILYTTAPAVGAMSFFNLVNTVQPGEIGAADGNMVYEERPQWFKNWETTGLLAYEDKNGDGRIQYYNEKNAEFAQKAEEEFGWQGNEMVKVDRDIMVLANPEIANLPNWVIALVVAGGLAAALSTAAGLLMAISSAVSHDLLKGVFKPGISEKQELMAARIAMAGAILVAGWLGLHPPGFAAQVVALAFGLAAASLFPALIMGIFNKRLNSTGAITGMLVGLFSTLIYIFWFKGWFFIPGTEMMANNADNWFLGIQPESFGAVGALLNFITAWVVSKVTTPPPDHIQHLVEDIRVPHQRNA